MKKIINGKRYDTQTAKMVGEWENGYCSSDFDYHSEALYRKVTGEYFQFSFGGPRTEFRSCCGNNSWSAGYRFTPLTAEEARQFAEEYLTADQYEAEFGPVNE